MFKRSFDGLDIKYPGTVTSKAYDINNTKKDHKALNEIQQLAAKINAADEMN